VKSTSKNCDRHPAILASKDKQQFQFVASSDEKNFHVRLNSENWPAVYRRETNRKLTSQRTKTECKWD